jgi:two-component system response regulator VicR
MSQLSQGLVAELGPAPQRGPRVSGRALLIEHDDDYAALITTLLQRDGWQVERAQRVEDALRRLAGAEFRLVIADTEVDPPEQGPSSLARVRDATSAPIIALSAPDQPEDIVQRTLEVADYDLVKPFSPRRLRAAVLAVSRRGRIAGGSPIPSEVRVGDIMVILGRLEVVVRGRTVELSPREFALLHFLMAHPGTVFTREELARLAWGWHGNGESRAIDNTVRRLRRKIEADPKRPRYILTERGVGYRFGVP